VAWLPLWLGYLCGLVTFLVSLAPLTPVLGPVNGVFCLGSSLDTCNALRRNTGRWGGAACSKRRTAGGGCRRRIVDGGSVPRGGSLGGTAFSAVANRSSSNVGTSLFNPLRVSLLHPQNELSIARNPLDRSLRSQSQIALSAFIPLS